MALVRILLAMMLLLGGLVAARADEGVSTSEHDAIKTVIERQIAAFRRDDDAAAFSFASPAIQHQFVSPEIFMRMVQKGYAMVYRPRSLSFGPAKRVGGGIVQEVDIIGPEGDGARAFYLMEHESDGSWRINGVTLAPAAERET